MVRRATIRLKDAMFEEEDLSEAVNEQLKKESTNFQWNKVIMNYIMLILLFTINLLRGDGKEPSIIGVTRCKQIDWVLFGTLIFSSTFLTITAIIILRKEYTYKKTIEYPFV